MIVKKYTINQPQIITIGPPIASPLPKFTVNEAMIETAVKQNEKLWIYLNPLKSSFLYPHYSISLSSRFNVIISVLLVSLFSY